MTYSSGPMNPDDWADAPPPAPEPPSGGWQPTGGWQPPDGGWPGPAVASTPSAPLHKRRTHPAAAAALIVGAAVVSVGVGHYLWPAATPSATAAGATSPSAPSSSGASSGVSPFAGGGSFGTTPYSGSGSGGSGSGGSEFGGSEFGGSPFGAAGGSSGGSSGTSSAASGAPANVSSIATKVSPALVDINTTFNYQSAAGAGTGIVLTSNGEILTNNHVINGATSISVTDIGNGRTYKASVVGYDLTADVAVLQLQGASGLQTAQVAKSPAKVGDPVVAVGNAGGVGGTPSSAGGSVTGLNQAITASDQLDGTSEQLAGLIEVNADIQAGDSGGSLVNSAGEVIGMDTAASSGYSLQSQTNRGYAIPIDSALSIVEQIEAGKSSATVHVGPTAFLGVLISASGAPTGTGGYYGGLSSGSAGNAASAGGAQVGGVVSGGAAANAGLTAGDTITSVNGQAISTASSLSRLIAQDRPGDKVQLTWTDQYGQSHTATVDLGSGPPA